MPAPLPPDWEFPEPFWPSLHEAGKQLSKLDGIGQTLRNPSILLRPLRNREAILSSRMEGTYATAQELLLFERAPGDPSKDDEARNQHREVANYASALDYATQTDQPLGLALIRQMHQELMTNVRGEDQRPGEFRTGQVGIGQRGKATRFVPPPHEFLNDVLDQFDSYLHRENHKYDPLVECFLVHYQFETIHPFTDGNGRVGRLLLTVMLQRLCKLNKPWLHMSEFFGQDHKLYCNHLYRISTDNAWSDWIAYCLEGVAWLAERTISRCNQLLDLREQFRIRVQQAGVQARILSIAENLFEQPFISVLDAQKLLGVSYPTANSYLQKLTELNILEQLKHHRPKTFYCPEIWNIMYVGLE